MKCPRRVLLSVAGLLFGAAWAAQAAPAPDPLCLDRDELIAATRDQDNVLFKMLYDPANPRSLSVLLKPEYEKLAVTQQQAQAGDVASAARLGKLWAECLLDGTVYSQTKQALIAQFLQTARQGGDKDAAYYLGLFAVRGLPSGSPSLSAAVPLFIESGRLAKDAKGSDAASSAYALALADSIPRTVTPAIVTATRGRTPPENNLTLQANYRFCPPQVSVGEAPPPADASNPALLAALSAPLTWLPTDGLACAGPDDQRGIRMPLTFPATAPTKKPPSR
ncbi:hypothetical protein [Xanthomonas sacchari]|uniref:hypothetical protein n=1 Tax=Xanthomonas sacchari TaxID=56458 RepID=UPI0005821E3A|nr:hypothetical protein [Xanthomonas sacchari]AJC44723.1 hypothetical protein SB85_02040 [Xanthomonas sacchari]